MRSKIICTLFTLIAVAIVYIDISSLDLKQEIKISNNVKYVDSEVLFTEEVKEDAIDVVKELVVEEVKEENIEINSTVNVEEVVVEETVPVIENKTEVTNTNNEILFGKMSGYGPDCVGCSGYVAAGLYVGNNIYYNDREFGNVRIVAGDKKFKFGTIVKINDSMLAIVLDRGGSIGIGKKFLFDLLYESETEAYKHGVADNTKFEIIRNGF